MEEDKKLNQKDDLNALIQREYNKFKDGDNSTFSNLVALLTKKSRFITYKFYYLLKDYGYSPDAANEYSRHIAIEFLTKNLNNVNNIAAYFIVYLRNKFISVYEVEAAKKRQVNHFSMSLDQPIGDNNETLHDVLNCGENIASWYNGRDILDRYIYDPDNKVLTTVEKKIILMKVEGYSYKDISATFNITFKEAVTIYTRGIRKLKIELKVF